MPLYVVNHLQRAGKGGWVVWERMCNVVIMNTSDFNVWVDWCLVNAKYICTANGRSIDTNCNSWRLHHHQHQTHHYVSHLFIHFTPSNLIWVWLNKYKHREKPPLRLQHIFVYAAGILFPSAFEEKILRNFGREEKSVS